jgi:hypothetical protein
MDDLVIQVQDFRKVYGDFTAVDRIRSWCHLTSSDPCRAGVRSSFHFSDHLPNGSSLLPDLVMELSSP